MEVGIERVGKKRERGRNRERGRKRKCVRQDSRV
jgi:hypothetical protein